MFVPKSVKDEAFSCYESVSVNRDPFGNRQFQFTANMVNGTTKKAIALSHFECNSQVATFTFPKKSELKDDNDGKQRFSGNCFIDGSHSS